MNIPVFNYFPEFRFKKSVFQKMVNVACKFQLFKTPPEALIKFEQICW